MPAAGLFAGPALVKEPDLSSAPQVAVTLSSFDFHPSSIQLRAGQPVMLHLGTHTMHAVFGMTGEIVVD